MLVVTILGTVGFSLSTFVFLNFVYYIENRSLQTWHALGLMCAVQLFVDCLRSIVFLQFGSGSSAAHKRDGSAIHGSRDIVRIYMYITDFCLFIFA